MTKKKFTDIVHMEHVKDAGEVRNYSDKPIFWTKKNDSSKINAPNSSTPENQNKDQSFK